MDRSIPKRIPTSLAHVLEDLGVSELLIDGLCAIAEEHLAIIPKRDGKITIVKEYTEFHTKEGGRTIRIPQRWVCMVGDQEFEVDNITMTERKV